jgi:NAD(P)-dependent dehydrogenase (short-subunit alcohol dehydrogenase family)
MTTVERWLEGRHAVVTGGSRGIGAGIADALARRGASITIMARSADALAERAARLGRTHATAVTAIVCDVSDDASVDDAFARATAEHGPVHVLVNSAGIATSRPFVDTTPEIWRAVLAVNLTGVFLCTRQVVPAMVAAGAGRIVNMASTAALRGFKTMAAYSAAKHGVLGLTRVLALETAKHGITVNAVCPGYVETDMVEQGIQNLVTAKHLSRDEARQMMLRPIPTGRFSTVEEVSSAVEWLCSPDAASVTGIALPIAGGEVQ